MSYLTAAAHRWPILRIGTKIVIAFTLAIIAVWLATDFLIVGLVGH
jgi:hypothetical protein